MVISRRGPRPAERTSNEDTVRLQSLRGIGKELKHFNSHTAHDTVGVTSTTSTKLYSTHNTVLEVR